MEAIKIHYMGFGVQTLHDGATIEDAVFHLGAKYGAQIYNEARKKRLITFHKNTVVVRPFEVKVNEGKYNMEYSLV
jgi:hypothetical protein